MSAPRLAGKTAVITGAGRRGGLGAGIAARLAAEGAAIVLSDVGAAIEPSKNDAAYAREIDKLAAEIGAKTSAFICDVRDWDQVQALAAHAVEQHGSLDIWVNNAGIGSIMKPLLTLEPEDWTTVIDVNLTGAFFGLRAAADVMVRQGKGGRIINIASQASKSGFIHAQAYTASKHGLVGLVRSAAIELGPHGITVNNVCPNHVTTGLGPGRMNISPALPAMPRWSPTSRPCARAFPWAAPACPRTSPPRWPSYAPMTRPISPPNR